MYYDRYDDVARASYLKYEARDSCRGVRLLSGVNFECHIQSACGSELIISYSDMPGNQNIQPGGSRVVCCVDALTDVVTDVFKASPGSLTDLLRGKLTVVEGSLQRLQGIDHNRS